MVNPVARPLVSGLDLVRSKLMQDVIQERPRTVRPIQQLVIFLALMISFDQFLLQQLGSC